MSPYELPPIVRLVERLVVMVEEAVRRFACYHNNTFGTESRQQAHAVMRLCHRAWCDKEGQDFWLYQHPHLHGQNPPSGETAARFPIQSANRPPFGRCGPVIRVISALRTAISRNRIFTAATAGWPQ